MGPHSERAVGLLTHFHDPEAAVAGIHLPAANGFVIVSKDTDFQQRALLYGYPPKVIWVRLGNCTTYNIEQTLRRASAQIAEFVTDDAVDILELV